MAWKERAGELLRRCLGDRGRDETMVLACCVLTGIAVAPFTLVRVLAGEWLHAALDVTVVAVSATAGVYVWTTRRTRVVRHLMMAAFLALVVAVNYLVSAALLYWAYPATVASFFVLRPRVALAFNGVALVALIPCVLGLETWGAAAGFLATLVITNIFALVFATGMTRSQSQLRALAERDPLTGAGNRRALESALEAALARRKEEGEPASMLTLDIDHFKHVNDTHGHDVGDRVLQDCAHLLRAATGAGDQVFRYGGEELIVLAPGAAGESARELAEGIRARVRHAGFGGCAGVTVSIGVAEARRRDTPESWFRRADDRLYRAKQAGRDRICTGREGSASPTRPAPAGAAAVGLITE